MKYQPHVDGLRAIAVLPVVIFHLGSQVFTGGYVGVDVFFVISGYLITSILVEDMLTGRYSLLEFYKRRALRILPALSVVLVVTFLLSSLLFFPPDQRDVGNSILATATFLSNVYFWSGSGYFAAPAESQPLLHTWSLAVEEQFYILFPPLLFVAVKYARKHLLTIVVGLSILSFLACVLLTARDPTTAFYLLPTRAWEMGFGAGLALWVRGRVPGDGNMPLATIGLALVLVPMILLDKETVFPGWVALAPVLGATLLIGFGQGGWVGKLLSSAPLVSVGKVSYSFYLWHWPVIVFWKVYAGEHLSWGEMVMLGAVSYGLAVLSTHFIERPFRSKRFRAVPASKVVLTAGAGLAAIGMMGVLAMKDLLPVRGMPEDVRKIVETLDYLQWPERTDQFRTGTCFLIDASGPFENFDKKGCTSAVPGGYNVLLFGDSHAAHLAGPLAEAFPDINLMQATASGCRPLLDLGGASRCTDMRAWVFDTFLPETHVDHIILGGRWGIGDVALTGATVERLLGLADRVTIIGPTVEYKGNLPDLLARSLLRDEPFNFEELRTPGKPEINAGMAQAAKGAGAAYIDILAMECAADSCVLLAPDGIPMQYDYGHLTFSGARSLIAAHRAEFFLNM